MKTYIITRTTRDVVATYTVEANSPEEALRILNGEQDKPAENQGKQPFKNQ